MKNVMFVCAGNVFRSLAGELAARKIAPLDLQVHFSSAGIGARPGHRIRPDVRYSLDRVGLDPTFHQVRLLNEDLIAEQDILIAMSDDIRLAIKEKFDHDAVLFNDVAHGRPTSIPDLPDAVPDFKVNLPRAADYVDQTVRHIHDSMPALIARL